MRKATLILVALFLVAGAAWAQPGKAKAAAAKPKLEIATFAGGCFWCVETAFEGLPGVTSVISGATRAEQVGANAAAASWRIGAEERAAIDALLE